MPMNVSCETPLNATDGAAELCFVATYVTFFSIGPMALTPLYSHGTPQTDRDALIALYSATDGPNWKNNHNWNTGTLLSRWYGVKGVVETPTGIRVGELHLESNNLRGI